VRAFHDRAGREASFVATRPATKNTGASGVAIGFAGRSAVGTGEAVAPSRALKVCRTCCLVRKQALELRKRTRERQIVSLKHVDDHDFFTLAQVLNILLVVAVCDNRISTVYTYPEQRHVIVFWEYEEGIEILLVLHERMELVRHLGGDEQK
jgi:hypothetical protein